MKTFTIGETVTMPRWDATVPPKERMGPCVILGIEHEQHCQSGTMLYVRNAAGREMEIDTGWIEEDQP